MIVPRSVSFQTELRVSTMNLYVLVNSFLTLRHTNKLKSRMEALRLLKPNGNDIVNAVSLHTAYDWVDIILLPAHITRCCFCGLQAKTKIG